jgi:hypothetical protein
MGSELGLPTKWSILSERESQHVLLVVVFIEKIILEDDQDSSWAFAASRNWYQHMRCGIDGYLFFSDDSIHPEIHLVVDDRLLDSSHVDDGLLIFDFAVVHLNAHKQGVITAGIESNNVYADAMGLVSLTGRVQE